MVMDLDFLVDFVVAPHQFADRVLLEHVEHVPLGVEAPRVDVHFG